MTMITAINKEDQELLEGIKKSDGNKINKVYSLALPSVIKWIEENNGSESDARDVFQEALIALFRKLESKEFNLTCTLKSFLRIMCRNLWLTKLRDNKKFEASPLEEIETYSLDEDLVEQLEQSEREQLFFKHFDYLDEKCRNILKWFFDKVPLREIAEKLDTSENYIKKRKFICKEKLISAIQNDRLYLELQN